MSTDERWSEFPKAVALSDDIFIAILDEAQSVADQNEIITVKNAKKYYQTPWLDNESAAGFNLTDLGILSFDDTNTTLTQSVNDLLYDVSTTGSHTFRVNDIIEATIEAGLFTGFESSNISTDSFEIRLQRENTGTVVSDGDSLGKLTFYGNDNSSPTFAEGGILEFEASETWGGTDHGSRFNVYTTVNTEDTPTLQFTIGNNGNVNFRGNDADLNGGNVNLSGGNVTNVNSLTIQDTSDTNLYTILGSELAGNFDAILPILISNDTFAFLGVDQTFTGSNTFNETLIVSNEANETNLDLFAFNDFADGEVLIRASRSRGTESSPTAILDGDTIYENAIRGHDGTSFVDCGNIIYEGVGDFTATNRGSRFLFNTQPINNTDVPQTRLIVGSEGETSFEGNDVINVGSLTTNNTYLFSDGSTQAQASTVSGIDWKLSTAYFNQSYNVSDNGGESTPTTTYFKPDGTKMFVLGIGLTTILQYTLTTPWDISTAGTPVNSTETFDTPLSLFFRSDGKKMYIGDTVSSGTIYEYDLTNAWDITDVSLTTSISSSDSSPSGIFFRPDGLKMYITGNGSDNIYELDLTIPWDIDTASLVTTIDVSDQDTAANGLHFKPDGLKMYITGSTNDNIYEYNLDTAWDISTFRFIQDFDISSIDNSPQDIFFRQDSLKMYLVGNQTNSIIEFNLGIGNSTVLTIDRSLKPLDTYVFSDDSTQAQASTPSGIDWKLSTVQFLQSFSVSAQDTVPRAMFFKPDGLKMFMVGTQSSLPEVFQYDLSTAWDISTAVVDATPLSVSAQDTQMFTMFFRSDGLKMYLAGSQNNSVYEYDLSTAWDIDTAVYTGTPFALTDQGTPTGLFFRPDGIRMYVSGQVPDVVDEYILSTPWDITTATTTTNDFTIPDTAPTGLHFKPDGLKMYISGEGNDSLFEFILSTPWDITTAVLNFTYSDLSSIDNSPQDTFFRPDGLKMYVVGNQTNSIIEFDLGITVLGKVGIGTEIPLSTLSINGSVDVKIVETSTDLTTDNDYIIGVTDNTPQVTITLSTVDTVLGRIIIINDQQGTAASDNIIIDTEGSETIDGATSKSIAANNGTMRVYCNGTNWFTW